MREWMDRIDLFDSVLSKRLLENPFVSLVGWVIFPLVFAYLFGDYVESVYGSLKTLGFVVGCAIFVCVVLRWSVITCYIRSASFYDFRLHWAWLLVGVAVLLRLLLYEYLPLDGAFPLEEMNQAGAGLHVSYHGGDLPLKTRFTAVMAGLGFLLFEDTSLETLRSVFKVSGLLQIVIMALTLRRMSVSWPATLVSVFTMSSLSWLVMGSGLAYENFSALLFVSLLLYCIVASATSRDNSLVWAGLAGVSASILLYEYDSFRVVAALVPLFWFVKALLSKNSDVRRCALHSGGVYMVCLSVVAAPIFAELFSLSEPGNILIDATRRHHYEGAGLSSVLSYLSPSFDILRMNFWAIIGIEVSDAGIWRLPNGSVVPPVVGVLFGYGVFYALTGKQGLLPFTLAFILIVILVTSSLTTINFLLDRIAVVLPMAIFLVAPSLDVLLRFFKPTDGVSWTDVSLLRNPVTYLTLLTIFIVFANVSGTIDVSSNSNVVREFQNRQYFVCRTIGMQDLEFDDVVVYAWSHCGKRNVELWLYPDLAGKIENVDSLPLLGDLRSGTLYVLGNSHGEIDDRLKSDFLLLATRSNSAHTVRTTMNLSGKTATVSFCYECVSKHN